MGVRDEARGAVEPPRSISEIIASIKPEDLLEIMERDSPLARIMGPAPAVYEYTAGYMLREGATVDPDEVVGITMRPATLTERAHMLGLDPDEVARVHDDLVKRLGGGS